MSAANTDATCRRDVYGQDHTPAGSDARIVSLVPSITELLYALGLGAQVVGRTGFCIHPRGKVRAIPKLGGTKDVDLDALAGLAPTHVIVNVDENTLPTFEALKKLVPHVIVTHPNAPADNLTLYRLLGAIFRREREAESLVTRFEAALARLKVTSSGSPLRRVLYLIWREPWMTVSADTYIARMLALVNWHTVPISRPERYPILPASELAAFEPDLWLLSSEPYPFRDKHLDEVQTLAGAKAQVRLIDGEMLSWYGPRAIAGLDYLGQFATTVSRSAA